MRQAGLRPNGQLGIERTQYEAWLRARWSMPDAPQTEWMTAGKAQRALDEMRADKGLDQMMVSEIAAYLDKLAC